MKNFSFSQADHEDAPKKPRMALAVLLAVLALVFGLCVKVLAVSGILVGSMVNVNNTTLNSTSIVAGTLTIPGGYMLIQNGGLTATTALTVNWQFSIDGSNFATVSTYQPSITNATTDRFFLPSSSALQVWYRAQVVTTNSVNVGVTFQQ